MPLPNKPLSEYDDLDIAIVEYRSGQIRSRFKPGPRKCIHQEVQNVYLKGFGDRLFVENYYH